MTIACIRLVVVLVVASLNAVWAGPVMVNFINVSDEPVKLYWINHDSEEIPVEELESYKDTEIKTSIGHVFCAYYEGRRQIFQVEGIDSVHVIGPDTIQVECSSSSGDIHATIKPNWSPRGAARFLELVDIGYFDGCALNRVVKNFLTQFGISADYKMRTDFATAKIKDDAPKGIAFQPGYMSYAGNGQNSRTTEMFIVMPGTHRHQLAAFGSENPWETPFGFVDPDDLSSVVDKWYAYGDMPPWGTGPDPQKIYREDGYEYLQKEFPRLSYLNKCRILSANDSEEEEL